MLEMYSRPAETSSDVLEAHVAILLQLLERGGERVEEATLVLREGLDVRPVQYTRGPWLIRGSTNLLFYSRIADVVTPTASRERPTRLAELIAEQPRGGGRGGACDVAPSSYASVRRTTASRL